MSGRTSAEFIQAMAPRRRWCRSGTATASAIRTGKFWSAIARRGAQVLRTDLDGAVLARLAATRIEVQTERRRRARYWLQ
jgi:beta-lactamase superfamily II metal-dependent hydrolase